MSAARVTLDGHGLGALKDPVDHRDHLYADYLRRVAPAIVAPPPPAAKVLADAEVDILDQDDLGSCTANEAVAHYAMLLVNQGRPPTILSRLEIYRDSRMLLSPRYAKRDSGSTGRATAKTLANKGACPETLWRYDITKFDKAPPVVCTKTDPDHNLIEYLSIPAGQPDTLDLIKTSLAAGYPVGYSITLHSNFRPNRDGIIPLAAGEAVGGHRMLLVGYDDATGLFDDRNSWGKDWGKGGRCRIHYDMIFRQGGDFWTYRAVEG